MGSKKSSTTYVTEAAKKLFVLMVAASTRGQILSTTRTKNLQRLFRCLPNHTATRRLFVSAIALGLDHNHCCSLSVLHCDYCDALQRHGLDGRGRTGRPHVETHKRPKSDLSESQSATAARSFLSRPASQPASRPAAWMEAGSSGTSARTRSSAHLMVEARIKEKNTD